MSEKRGKKTVLLADFGMIFTALVWGFAFVVVKDSVDSVPPVYMLAFRFTIAFLGLALVFCKKIPMIRKIRSGLWVILRILAVYQLFLPDCGDPVYNGGEKCVFDDDLCGDRAVFKLDHCEEAAGPVLCGKRPFLPLWGSGCFPFRGDLTMNIGDVLTIVCGFGYAFHMFFIDRFTEKHDPIIMTLLQIGTAALISWIVSPFMDGAFPVAVFTPRAMSGMLYLGLVSTMVAFLLQNVCQKYTTATSASLFLSLESVFGVLCSVIFLKEHMTPRMILGCVLLFTAIILAETKLSFLKSKSGNNKIRRKGAA